MKDQSHSSSSLALDKLGNRHDHHDIENDHGDASSLPGSNAASDPFSMHDLDASGYTMNHNPRSSSANLKEEKILAAQETRHVRRLKIIMLSVLLVFCVLLSSLVYYYVRQFEQTEFETEFASNGNKVLTAFQEDSLKKMQALFSLSSSITSYAQDSQSEWPFVTLPNSAAELAPYLSLADAAALTIYPIVPPALRAEWELYSVRNQHWIEEDLEMMKATLRLGDSNNENNNSTTVEEPSSKTTLVLIDYETEPPQPPTNTNHTITPYIKNYVGVDTSPGIWTPWWQYYPVIANRWFVNFNQLAWAGFEQQVQTVQAGKATLSQTSAFQPGLDFQSTKDFDFFSELLQAGGGSGSEGYLAGEPLSYISYPIFDQLPSSSSNTEASQEVAAVLTATVYWKTYFQGILANNVRGIVCVVSNSANQAFSYEINGKRATFLGMYDAHNPKYDHLKLSAEYSFGHNNNGNDDNNDEASSSYTGVPVDDTLQYRLEVYPGQALEEEHLSSNPIYFALSIACVFVLCAIVFWIYNMLVEQRQRLVLTTAVKSTAVVDSMFPENVRDRLLENAVTPQESNSSKKAAPSSRLLETPETNKDPKASLSSAPIADHFEETTIFFADLKGFTKWCANRQPVEVFTLLETLYGEFDKVAQRRRVYKVETVGDSYVAVTGLPEARRDHALAMARFSRDVLSKFRKVCHDLETTLSDTNTLDLRIGMHSGPVTAGVIRGQNARFQLFGDTVNTASRMESNGEGGKIQISQSTADLLAQAGKKNWYTPREDKIVAKGKGELQTYWLLTSKKSAGANNSMMEFSSPEHDVEIPTGMSNVRRLDSYEASASETGSSCGDLKEEDDMVSGDMSFVETALQKRIDAQEQEIAAFDSSATAAQPLLAIAEDASSSQKWEEVEV